MKRLTRNAIRCKSCNDVIESKFTHDFKYCKCGKVMIDGGLSYERYGWPSGDPADYIEELFEYSEVP